MTLTVTQKDDEHGVKYEMIFKMIFEEPAGIPLKLKHNETRGRWSKLSMVY